MAKEDEPEASRRTAFSSFAVISRIRILGIGLERLTRRVFPLGNDINNY